MGFPWQPSFGKRGPSCPHGTRRVPSKGTSCSKPQSGSLERVNSTRLANQKWVSREQREPLRHREGMGRYRPSGPLGCSSHKDSFTNGVLFWESSHRSAQKVTPKTSHIHRASFAWWSPSWGKKGKGRTQRWNSIGGNPLCQGVKPEWARL